MTSTKSEPVLLTANASLRCLLATTIGLQLLVLVFAVLSYWLLLSAPISVAPAPPDMASMAEVITTFRKRQSL